MKITEREKVYLFVINELIKEKKGIEEKMSLPVGWIRPKDHPRIGELLSVLQIF